MDFDLEGGLFDEPEDFRKKEPEPHYANYERKSENGPVLDLENIKLRLVGSSPLWGHLLWNAGIFTADYLDKHADTLVKGKKVLELGAAAGLPSIIASLNDASIVVCTDYPDPELINNIKENFSYLPQDKLAPHEVTGYIWGNDYTEITKSIEGKFDTIILSDLVFNHTEHHKLLTTCKDLLDKNGRCLVVFSPHRPHLLEDDLRFFETAKDYGFRTEKIDLVSWKPMFEEDAETADIRARVYSFFMYPEA